MKFIALSLVAATWASAVSGAPLDRLNITPEEHAACDSDAMSLCAYTYPNELQLIDCMRTNQPKLSPVCKTTFVSGLKRRHLPL